MKKGSVIKKGSVQSETAAHNFSWGDSRCAPAALKALRNPAACLFNFVSILDDLRIPSLTSPDQPWLASYGAFSGEHWSRGRRSLAALLQRARRKSKPVFCHGFWRLRGLRYNVLVLTGKMFVLVLTGQMFVFSGSLKINMSPVPDASLHSGKVVTSVPESWWPPIAQ